MGRMYIANVSRQKQIVTYRMDIDNTGAFSERLRQNALRYETIERGRQIAVSGDLHAEQIKTIVDQLSVYGLVAASDVPNRLRGCVDLIFNLDAPVSKKVMEAVHDHNMGVKVGEGALRREHAAVAAHEVLAQRTGETPQSFDVEFEQEEVSEMDEKSIAAGFHVVAKPNENQTPPGRKVA